MQFTYGFIVGVVGMFIVAVFVIKSLIKFYERRIMTLECQVKAEIWAPDKLKKLQDWLDMRIQELDSSEQKNKEK